MNFKGLSSFGRIRGRQVRAVVAIALWLWSGWATAACCCDPFEGARSRSSQVTEAGLGESADHPHHHETDSAAGGASHHGSPTDDCDRVKTPQHGVVSKSLAPPAQPLLDPLVVLAATSLFALHALPAERLAKWSVPPPIAPPHNPYLKTVRLLL